MNIYLLFRFQVDYLLILETEGAIDLLPKQGPTQMLVRQWQPEMELPIHLKILEVLSWAL